MNLDWRTIDRWIMGEAWTGSRINEHLRELCDNIGPRWASSEAERQAATYIQDQMQAQGLQNVALEAFQMDTWAFTKAEAEVIQGDRPIGVLPFMRCPSFSVQARIVDVGFGTPREINLVKEKLSGSIAIMFQAYEPFTTPIHHARRLEFLAQGGASASVVISRMDGGRMGYQTAGDWRDPGLVEHPLPTVLTSREDGALLRRLAKQGKTLRIEVESQFFQAPTANVVGELEGARWPEEHLLLGAHHDTVYDSPGGNDDASGLNVVMETARVLSRLGSETGQVPGRSIRFVSYSAEEQKLQGSSEYVKRHHGPETPPRLVVTLDELSTGHIKGMTLAFPHLRDLVQAQLDTMNDGLQCHVHAQIDASGDNFPFVMAGIDTAGCWRWRFYGRHADAEYHHERWDTADKVKVRELKEYVGQLARILFRLSHVPPKDWPANPNTPAQVRARLDAERDAVVRVF